MANNNDKALVYKITHEVLTEMGFPKQVGYLFLEKVCWESGEPTLYGKMMDSKMSKDPYDVRMRFTPFRMSGLRGIVRFLAKEKLYKPTELKDVVVWKELIARICPECTNFCDFGDIVLAIANDKKDGKQT